MMETPKTAGFQSAGPRRLSLTTNHYRQLGIVSSPLATSSPSPLVFSSSAAAAVADRTPLRRPKQPPRCSSIVVGPQFHQQFPSSRTNTLRSTVTDMSSIYTIQQDEAAFDERNAQLLQCIQMQQELVEQATAAIAYCRKKFPFSGTLQELSAQRLLLVSQERLTLLNRQMDQLKDQRILANFSGHLDDIPESVDFENEDEQESVVPFMHGTLYIDKIVLNLNPSFSLKKIDKESSFAFIVLCRHANTIYATQMANVLDVGELRNNKVKFKELIVFEDLTPEFCILIEVFAMKIGKRMDHKWHCVWSFAARTFRSLMRSIGASPSQTDGNNNTTINSRRSVAEGASASASSTFGAQSNLVANKESKFYLSDADYPLEGSMELFVRFAPCNSPVQPPRPDSTDVDLRFSD
uniref:Anillin homology domain-containing protein n=1 Tax=Globodera rostochiensis TaxID=31243 RepID=A0A914HVE1_GLORO